MNGSAAAVASASGVPGALCTRRWRSWRKSSGVGVKKPRALTTSINGSLARTLVCNQIGVRIGFPPGTDSATSRTEETCIRVSHRSERRFGGVSLLHKRKPFAPGLPTGGGYSGSLTQADLFPTAKRARLSGKTALTARGAKVSPRSPSCATLAGSRPRRVVADAPCRHTCSEQVGKVVLVRLKMSWAMGSRL